MTTPVLLIVNGKTRVCFVPPVVIAPLAIALGISPQLEFNGARPGDVEKVLNGLIHAAHVGVESYAATVLANGAGIGLGSILSTPTGAVAACALQS